MCLRMGEDTIADHLSFSESSLHSLSFFFLSYHFPWPTLMSLPCHHYRFHFSTALSLSFNHLSALFVLPSATYSISSLQCLLSVSITFLLLPAGRQPCYLITLTMQDAVCAHVSHLRDCICVCAASLFEGQVQGLGSHTACYPRGTNRRKGRRQAESRKNKMKCLWNIEATGACIS